MQVLIQHATDPTAETSFQCSGTLVAPHVVVTAAHCIHEKLVGEGQSFYVFFGDDSNSNEQLANKKNFGYAKSVTAHPDFDPTSAGSGTSLGGSHAPAHDIAVIVLLDEAPGVPRAMQREPLGADAVGRELHAFGYGETKAGVVDSSGQRFAMTTTITNVTEDDVVFLPDASLCEGDSGGPSFVVDKKGVARLVGVHSYVEHATSCTGENYDARVDRDIAWIDGFVAAADPGFSAEPTDVGTSSAGDGANETPATSDGAPTANDGAPAKTTTTGGCHVAVTRASDAAGASAWVLAFAALLVVRRSRPRSPRDEVPGGSTADRSPRTAARRSA